MLHESLSTPIVDRYDVAVCGGGFGGISAALAAARHGKKVILFEKMYILGGLGTAGIVTIYLPLCDGLGHQVSFGIAEELLRLSIRHGAEGRYPANWLDGEGTRTEKDKRFEVQYNPALFAMDAEKLLLDSGVDILYGAYAVGTETDGDRISHVIIESKSGRTAYAVDTVVDATGDCDIAWFAGAPTETFHQGNILASWYYSNGSDGYKLHMLGCCDIPDEEKKPGHETELLLNRRFAGLDQEEISEFLCLSHQSTLRDVIGRRKDDPDYWPVTMATMPQLRMTRRIVGEYELGQAESHKRFEDSVGMIANWRKREPVYEVPFRTLYSAKMKNLITAGRCTSVTEGMWDLMRVIPCCAVTGQAAGTAAAMTDDFTAIDIKTLQTALEKDGVVLHETWCGEE